LSRKKGYCWKIMFIGELTRFLEKNVF
jgi:hypothetical protein